MFKICLLTLACLATTYAAIAPGQNAYLPPQQNGYNYNKPQQPFQPPSSPQPFRPSPSAPLPKPTPTYGAPPAPPQPRPTYGAPAPPQPTYGAPAPRPSQPSFGLPSPQPPRPFNPQPSPKPTYGPPQGPPPSGPNYVGQSTSNAGQHAPVSFVISKGLQTKPYNLYCRVRITTIMNQACLLTSTTL